MIEITRDTIIGDILDVAPQTAPIFLSTGGRLVHGIDVDKLLALVNEEANKKAE